MLGDFLRIVAALVLGFGVLAIAHRYIDPPGEKRTGVLVNAIGAAVALVIYFGSKAIWP